MTEDIWKRLAEPFDPTAVSWRVGSLNKDKTKAMALAYVDARDVMDRLDAVCGPFGWQSEHVVTGDMVTCHIRIRDPETGEWITKSDGAGKTDVEGEKGSYSDSLKRAAVAWGVARYLYSTASPWVAVEPYGRSYRIADSEKGRLLAALPRPGKAAPVPAGERSAPPASQAPPTGTAQQAPAASGQTALPINRAAMPPTAEQPPAVTAARLRIKTLIDQYDHRIRTAPNKHALELVMDDGRDELAEIEAAGEAGKEAAGKLRGKFMTKMDQFEERAA